ncbi:alpha/beta fold hydrolase [Chitinophaga niabensis]|uniref:Proline iminopeptidase n=1 Tax=Chitinophaga niabensis TaxID=536979 RepID=A0A1N6ENE0_9BACT|nr:alpha/beta hydrolase [Chitinophaga niabensis]SIN84490.1 proline iminopeptidase [Chitinophaga niabensis]
MKLPVIIAILFFMAACQPNSTYTQLNNADTAILTSDSVQLVVKVAGQGVPCIFVHGGPGGGFLSFEKMGGNNLEQCMTMVYYDQRGSGSSQNAADYSLDRMVEDIEELRQAMKSEKVYLLSHSFGGIIAFNYAKKYPSHVYGLILANATLHFFNTASIKEQVEYGYRLLGRDTVIQETDSLLQLMTVVRKEMSKQRIGYKFLTDDIQTIVRLDSLDEMYPRTNDFGMAIVAPLLDTSGKVRYPEYSLDYTVQTSRLQLPVLTITGNNDHAIGIHHYEKFRFPQQEVVKINGGHLLYYEQNAAFVKAVCAFIKAKGAGQK